MYEVKTGFEVKDIEQHTVLNLGISQVVNWCSVVVSRMFSSSRSHFQNLEPFCPAWTEYCCFLLKMFFWLDKIEVKVYFKQERKKLSFYQAKIITQFASIPSMNILTSYLKTIWCDQSQNFDVKLKLLYAVRWILNLAAKLEFLSSWLDWTSEC
jgi:hypothetical protein